MRDKKVYHGKLNEDAEYGDVLTSYEVYVEFWVDTDQGESALAEYDYGMDVYYDAIWDDVRNTVNTLAQRVIDKLMDTCTFKDPITNETIDFDIECVDDDFSLRSEKGTLVYVIDSPGDLLETEVENAFNTVCGNISPATSETELELYYGSTDYETGIPNHSAEVTFEVDLVLDGVVRIVNNSLNKDDEVSESFKRFMY